MNNKFVFIIACRNNENWIETNLESVLCQTYKNYEVIYIDDASTDNTGILFNKIVNNDPRFFYIKHETQEKSRIRHILDVKDEESIIVELDGDDWLATNEVLEKYNDFYNKHDCWSTYGKMLVWIGDDNPQEAYPQNTAYSDFVKKYSLYKKDIWRASHLRTYRRFLYSAINQNSLMTLESIFKNDKKEYPHAIDLANAFSLLEISPADKVLPVDFISVVWNAHPDKMHLTRERENTSNFIYEDEIRNRKKYKRANSKNKLKGEFLPQVNVFGAFCENNSIPTRFSFCYEKTYGEFDITAFHDQSIFDYINGNIKISTKCKKVAEIFESPHIFDRKKLYTVIKENYKLFDKIYTYDDELLTLLPNATFRNVGEVVLNKNIHTKEHPNLADDTLIKLYDKYLNVSFISSNKQMCGGHTFRLQCLKEVIDKGLKVDIFGKGINDIVGKIEGLHAYKFSVAIENGEYKNYFTEKILDCFLTGTIPIYHGCPNIGDFFDINGFFTFNTTDELLKIINSLTDEQYKDRFELVKLNFLKALSFRYNNDIYFERYYKNLL